MIPEGFMPKTYFGGEDVLMMRGDSLSEGDVVLIADNSMRESSERFYSEYDKARALETSRWCKVTELEFTEMSDPYYGTISLVGFVGIYADGSMIIRKYNTSYRWYVKHKLDFDSLES